LAAATIFEIVLGTTLSLVTFLLSDLIGNNIFNRPEIAPPNPDKLYERSKKNNLRKNLARRAPPYNMVELDRKHKKS